MHRQWFPRLSELFQCSLSGQMYDLEHRWNQYQNNPLFIWLRIRSGQARKFLTPISHLPILYL